MQELDLPTIEGPDASYVRLVSSDNHNFLIPKDLAFASDTIRTMFEGPGAFMETETNTVHLKTIPSHILQKVCHYFAYRYQYQDLEEEFPDFEIQEEMALDLYIATHFLEC
uniref:Elongin-C n=1 Tax=Rhabditophanes sp. KR3021 TaxID=114890 RepID=A0AC35UCM2_9BILA